MGTPLSGYARRFVGEKGENGIQGAGGADGADGFAQLVPITKTSNYTLVLDDANTSFIKMNVGSSNSVTVPTNASVAFRNGDYVFISQYGAGATTIVAGSGVTVRSLYGSLVLPGQYSSAMLIKIDTNEWVLSVLSSIYPLTGDVTTVGNVATLSKMSISTPSFSANNYTLVLSDDGKFLQLSNGATAGTLTVPLNSSVAFDVGSQIILTQTGTGAITFLPDSGVTINSFDGNLSFYSQYSSVSLIKVATNTWSLSGNLS